MVALKVLIVGIVFLLSIVQLLASPLQGTVGVGGFDPEKDISTPHGIGVGGFDPEKDISTPHVVRVRWFDREEESSTPYARNNNWGVGGRCPICN